MDEFLDNVDLKEVRRKIYVFCHLFILGWTICHVWASYQVFGVILFAVVLVIMLVGLEILYNALGEMQEKIQRLEKDVGELHDAQMAPEYDEEEEIREREMERAVRILRNVARMRSV
ncbi:Protein CBG26596 [Caenorhabditis briggsae]|uniref:Protein CBG26596 n=1 Tax=Caenorhabditis briggsae TaxID=6238 RepID=B6IKZ6_CAEBR|nr:Protein CBG26596 [Caenorhabditis briggsae]CAS00576.1 Protein CBG26596 [Caenorhabditis briggsae]